MNCYFKPLRGVGGILILPHNDPAPDAIDNAVALHPLLDGLLGVGDRIGYEGIISRAENRALVRYLDRPRKHLIRCPRREKGGGAPCGAPVSGDVPGATSLRRSWCWLRRSWCLLRLCWSFLLGRTFLLLFGRAFLTLFRHQNPPFFVDSKVGELARTSERICLPGCPRLGRI